MPKISVEIEALSQKFDDQMAKVNKGLSKLEAQAAKMNNFTAGITKFFAAFATVSAIEHAVKALYNFTQATSDATNAQSRFASSIGASASTVDKMEKAFLGSHVSIKEAQGAMQKLNEMTDESNLSTSEAAKNFRALGISAKEMQKLSPEQRMAKFFDATKKLGASDQKKALDMIGAGTPEMIEAAKKGGDAFLASVEKAVPVTDEARKNFEALDKSTLEMSKNWTVLTEKLAGELAPTITTAIDYFNAGLVTAKDYTSVIYDMFHQIATFNKLMGKDTAFPDAAPGTPEEAMMRDFKKKGGEKGAKERGEKLKKEQEVTDALKRQQAIGLEIKKRNDEDVISSGEKLKIADAIAVADEKGALEAQIAAQFKGSSDEGRELQLQAAMREKEAAASHELQYMMKDIAAVGNRRLEIETAIAKQYPLASKELQAQLADRTRELELAQKLKGMREGEAGGQLAIAKRDLDEMKARGQLGDKEYARRMSEAKESHLKAFGVQVGPEADTARKHQQIDEALKAGTINRRDAQREHLSTAQAGHEAKMSQLTGLGLELNPMQQLGEKLGKLNTELAAGNITGAEHQQILGSIGAKQFDTTGRLSGAQTAGSQDAFKTLANFATMQPNDPQIRMANGIDKMVAVLESAFTGNNTGMLNAV